MRLRSAAVRRIPGGAEPRIEGATVTRLRLPRRRVPAAVLAVGVALVLILGAGCQPPPNGPLIAKRIAWNQLIQRGWANQSQCLVDLWNAESGWNVYALNKASGAYGIPQALPAKQMAAAGPDWVRNPATQIRWGLAYIGQRYGGPCNAWRHWRAVHWYDRAAPPMPAAPVPAVVPSG
jgi:hypothetical protein